MSNTIQANKYVELSYRVIDRKTDEVLIAVEYPIGYVHGANDVLMPSVTDQLEGKAPGDVIDVSFNGNDVFGQRDEGLVFTDRIENVPEDYREVGATVYAENEKGDTLSFIVTRVDDATVTIDGNHPLCGREVIFKLEVLKVRDASPAEIEAGGPVGRTPNIDKSLLIPV
ncbi:MAG: hypothetical protein VW268_15580 [Rhodospirillaceae bacterium]